MTTHYLLLKQLPLSEIAWWRRWLVEVAYWFADWYGTHQIDFRSIASSNIRAHEMVNAHGLGEGGWVIVPLPVDEILPAGSVHYAEGPMYVNADQSERPERKQRPLTTNPTHDLRKLNEEIKTLARKAASA